MKKTNNKLEVTINLKEQLTLSGSSYEKMFLQTGIMKKRGDKSIYVRSEYHERLVRIQKIIGNDKIPLYAYLDKILTHHFEIFEGMILSEFNKKSKPLF